MGRDQIHRPGQRRRARLVARKKEDRNLIDHLLRGEGRAVFGVRGRHNLGRQIVGGSACLDRLHPLGRQRGDQLPDLGSAAFCILSEQTWQPTRQRHKCRDVQDRLAALVGFEFVKDLAGHMVFDGNRKQRAKDHIRCRVARLRFGL